MDSVIKLLIGIVQQKSLHPLVLIRPLSVSHFQPFLLLFVVKLSTSIIPLQLQLLQIDVPKLYIPGVALDLVLQLPLPLIGFPISHSHSRIARNRQLFTELGGGG